MKIVVTAGEIEEMGVWDQFCEMMGLNPWCRNEGSCTSETEFSLTAEQAREMSIIPRD